MEMDPAAGEALLNEARSLLAILQSQARRAFVLELTGTPKAGKSTSVSVLQTFFKQAGYQVHLLKERAADCPLPMKGHFFFNAWTMATMLAEVLETHETNTHLLILDRGFFDALIWLELQSRRDQVSPEEKKVFADFVLLERWRSLVDATVIMSVEPAAALQRENQNQVVRRTGSMMNPGSLMQFNEALEQVTQQYSSMFSLLRIDTTAPKGVAETNAGLLRELLPRIKEWADPKIAVVPKDEVVRIFGDLPFIHRNEAPEAIAQLAKVLSFVSRSEAEASDAVVQLIAAGIHTHKDKVVVLERDPRDTKTTNYGRRTLWVGCHIDSKLPDPLDASIECLNRRIQQDLHLWTRPQVEFLGLSWDHTQSDTQHLGLIFRAPIVSDYVADHLRDKQFKRMGRSGSIKSVFMTQEAIVSGLAELDLEPWSKYVARNISLTHATQGSTP
jgi:predicted NUDIX family phosphoesterase